MNILFFTPDPTDACSFYRGVGPFSQLRREGVHLTPGAKEINWASVSGNDVCYMQRPFLKQHLDAAKIVRRQIPLWVDFDDNLLEVPPSNPAFATFKEAVPVVKEFLQLADAITVSTHALAEQLAPLSRTTPIVIPNAHNDYLFGAEGSTAPRKRSVFWRGTDTHIVDLMPMTDAISRAATDFPEWDFVFMGAAPWMLENKLKLTWIAGQDIIRYHTMLREDLCPAIQIVPLADTAFNRAKSNCAWIEATMAGTCVLAPEWAEWEQPGTATYTDSQDFYLQLTQLMAQRSLDARVKASQKQVRDNYLLSQVNRQRLALLDELHV